MLTAAPIYISWNYTYACNFNCTHCYSRAGSYPGELDTESYRRIVQQFKESHVLKVGLGGGEPLIRNDCIDMLGLMAAARIDTNITSNGWFLNPAMCARLAEAGLGTLYVSMDSADRDTHDGFRRKTGSYDRVVEGITNAVAANLTVRLSTVITTINENGLEPIVDLAESLGVGGIEFKRFRPTGNGRAVADTLSLEQAGEATVRSTVTELDSGSALDIALVYGEEADGGIDSGCPCGIRSLTLRPNGDVAPCAYSDTVIGNLMNDDLGSMWRGSPALLAMRTGAGCSGLIRGPSPSGSGFAPTPRRLPLSPTSGSEAGCSH